VGVIIGMDPHKRSATIEVIDDQARVLAAGRYGTDTAGYAQIPMRPVRTRSRWPPCALLA
jgi:hypothetical protein